MAVLGAAAIAATGTLHAQDGRRGANYFPNVPVVTQDGKTLKFYDDVIKGKIVLISFIYTNCPDICPLTTARIAQVEEKLGDLVGRDIFLISMTVDPERDSPERWVILAWSERLRRLVNQWAAPRCETHA
jgi:cytochrome oxidase Cu insertion factor (SCO1/SenC/PrrC family)